MKKIALLIVTMFIATAVFAQSGNKKIGISIGETNSLTSIVTQKEQALINPQLLSADLEIKIITFLGLDFDISYDARLKELFMYDVSLKGYLPLGFIQPYVSVGPVRMTNPGVRTLTFEYNGETYSYTYEFNYQYSIKLGVDLFVLKSISIGAEIGYYGNDVKAMLDVISAKDANQLLLNSYGFVGLKLWM